MSQPLSLTGRKWILPSVTIDPANIVMHLAQTRGLTDVSSPEKLKLSDPFLFPEMTRAVERIRCAIDAGEVIGIFGDYDADGITGTAQLVRYFRRHGREPAVHLPHREKEGYGMKKASIDTLHAKGVGLLITVDTGIAATDEINHAGKLGMDVIVTDHHSAPDGRPPAFAVIHPRVPALFPNEHLSGSGVAFMLVRALENGKPWAGIEQDMVLAAIGTVGDLVPLIGENRTLVIHGLRLVPRLPTSALKSFFEQVNVAGDCTASDLAFRIVPRINASGRMDHPSVALDALLGNEAALQSLHDLNSQRQTLTEISFEHALTLVDDTRSFLCIASEKFTAGIVGLVAGKLTERYGRPSLVATIGKDDLCVASIRSIPGYDVAAALRDPSVRPLLEHCGGHAQAAGCTFHLSRLHEIAIRLHEHILASGFSLDALRPSLALDAVVSGTELTKGFAADLQRLQPFGQHNHEPLFLLAGQRLTSMRGVGRDGSHLQARLEGGQKVIGFGLGGLIGELSAGAPVDLAAAVGMERWNGREDLQLFLKDVRLR